MPFYLLYFVQEFYPISVLYDRCDICILIHLCWKFCTSHEVQAVLFLFLFYCIYRLRTSGHLSSITVCDMMCRYKLVVFLHSALKFFIASSTVSTFNFFADLVCNFFCFVHPLALFSLFWCFICS